tara:strand:- start:221 stop:967 length:747 start_codon:yes stop_codon:yes gene_type:complete
MSTEKIRKRENQHIIWNELKWEPSETQLSQFIQLQKLLKEWNKKVNLTRLVDGDDFWISQVCDSLLPLHKELQNPELSHSYIDIGSGCGFPGIAIAIAMPNSKITLLDASRKKTTFLQEVSKEIKLNSRITVITNRAEIAGRNPILRGNFDYAIARAVASANVVAEYLMPFLNSRGKGLIFKGVWSETEQHILKKALTKLNAEIQRTDRFLLPNNRGIRNIIKISPTNKCPNQYPRSVGKPKKQPLGH